jgi:hypothetical protein
MGIRAVGAMRRAKLMIGGAYFGTRHPIDPRAGCRRTTGDGSAEAPEGTAMRERLCALRFSYGRC